MLRVSDDYKLDFDDVLLTPRVSTQKTVSRSEVDLHIDGAVPIIVANMDHIGTFAIAQHLKSFRLQVALLKDFTADDWSREVHERDLDPRLLIPTLGTRDLDAEIAKIRRIVAEFPTIPFVCLDVANGYLETAAAAVRAVKDALPDVRIAAGNIVEEEGLWHLARAGADIIKVGIGSGGVCLTRKMTGVGYPQFSAIQELFPVAQEAGVALISDGGMTGPDAAAKAFAAGADYVMAGSYFAGHEETGLEFHGMSSTRSRADRGQEIKTYRASEGREVVLHPRGSLSHTITALLGGLNSACTMLNVRRLEDLKHAPLKATRVHHQLNRIQGIHAGS